MRPRSAVSLQLCLCLHSRATVAMQAPVVFRPSVNLGFSETAAWNQTKFYIKLHICHISRPFFFFFRKFSIFIFTFCFRFPYIITWSIWEQKFQTLLLSQLPMISPQFSSNFIQAGNQGGGAYRVLLSWRSAKLKTFGALKFFKAQEHMGLGISKRYSYSFHLISATLYEDIEYHSRIRAVPFLGSRPSIKKIVAL